MRHDLGGLSALFPPAYLFTFAMGDVTEELIDTPEADLSRLVRSRMGGMLGGTWSASNMSEGTRNAVANQIALYKRIRPILQQGVAILLGTQLMDYPDAPWWGWDAIEHVQPSTGDAVVFAFDTDDSAENAIVKPRALNPNASYDVESADYGLLGTVDGAELMDRGIELSGLRPHAQPRAHLPRALVGHSAPAAVMETNPQNERHRRFFLEAPGFSNIISGVSTTGRVQRTWRQGDPWTVHDAAELYEVARWGKGYFSIAPNGHMRVHPTKDPERSIDLKELVDQLQLRGINLPILLRFTDILRHRVGEIHDAFQTAIARVRLPGQLLLRLPDQGEPAAARRRGDPRLRQAVQLRPGGRLQAGTARRAGHDQRRRRRSSATASRTTSSSRWSCWPARSGKQIIPVVEKFTELELIVKYAEELGRPAGHRRARQAGRPRRGPLAVVRRATAPSSA